ncbi:uncharacterized protein LOC125677990 isoform X2 [Ostrea edulis]|uniref:uncharacterized protein LOC125677990 isoform X2 n=1 Tax=Ostrea edulis TaxID=37623 RepID=UPI0024AEECEA|nr:uncharacterized protein LOC125677990 isoform X2 [Ostrea edulis]
MMEAVVFIFLSILLVTVNTTSPQNNSVEECLQGFYWDKDSHQCQSCPIGYYGHNCSLPCRYPSYGERCQKECNCTVEYCINDKGCINKTNTHSTPFDTFYNVTNFEKELEEELDVEKYILRPACGIFAFLCILVFVVFGYRRRMNASNNNKPNNDCESYESPHREDNPCSASQSYTSLRKGDVIVTESTAESEENDGFYTNIPSIIEQNLSDELPMTIASGTREQVLTNKDTLPTTEKDFSKSLHAQPKFLNTNTGEDIYEDMDLESGNCIPKVAHIVQPSSKECDHGHTDDKTVNISDDINGYPCIESGTNAEDDGHSGENMSTVNAKLTPSINEEQGNRNELQIMSITGKVSNSESLHIMASPTNSVYVQVTID